MRRRCAISLVELLAALTGCSIVLGLTASLLHQTMRAQSHTRGYLVVERNALRLSRQFRTDIHAAAADAIELGDAAGDGELLRLRLGDDHSVSYARNADKIIRTASQPNGPTAREEFALSEAMTVEVRQFDAPKRYALSIVPVVPQPSQDSPPPMTDVRATPMTLEVEAAAARDLRHGEPTAGDGRAIAEEESP